MGKNLFGDFGENYSEKNNSQSVGTADILIPTGEAQIKQEISVDFLVETF